MKNYSPTPEQLAGIAKEEAQRKLLCKQVEEAHKAKHAQKFETKKPIKR